MKKYPDPKGPVSSVRRAEMMKQRYQQLQENGGKEPEERKRAELERLENEERRGMTYATTDEMIPRKVRTQINKRINDRWNDVEPAWRSQDPRKRISWPEFCRDFMGQNYGAIAQDLLEMHNSEDPALKVQFMKFMMEMGKQGNPSSLQLDVNAQIKTQSDIYEQLQKMTVASDPAIEDAKIIEPNLLEQGESQESQSKNQDIMANWHSMQTEDNHFTPEDEQQSFTAEDAVASDLNTAEEVADTEIVPSRDEKYNEFPPVCPICGARMVWSSDFMLSECGYIDDDPSLERDSYGIIVGDRVIHTCSCPECDCLAEFEDLENKGEMAILSYTSGEEDDDDRRITYSNYAVAKYGMPSYIG